MAVPTPTPGASTDDTDDTVPVTDHAHAKPAHERHGDAVELVTLVDDTAEGRQATVCPAKADATNLVTTWITVDADHLLDLANWR